MSPENEFHKKRDDVIITELFQLLCYHIKVR